MDATPVVADPNDVEATAFDGHVDVARACVQTVLEQFFHDLSRPLNDLTGRDVADGEVVKLLNSPLSHSIPPQVGRAAVRQTQRPAEGSCHQDPRWKGH